MKHGVRRAMVGRHAFSVFKDALVMFAFTFIIVNTIDLKSRSTEFGKKYCYRTPYDEA